MQVEVVESLQDVPDDAARALSYHSGQRFFSSIEWFRCLAGHGLDDKLRPRVYLAGDSNGIQCALFCASPGAGQLVSLTSFYTMEYGPVMAGDNAATGLAAIVGFIAAEKPRWNTIDLRFLRDGDATNSQLGQLLENNGFTPHAFAQFDNWYLSVDGRDFETYYRALSSRLRNTIRRKGNKLGREHEFSLDIYPVDDITLDDAIGVYEAVYSSSWKQPEPFPGFMPALFRTCDELGVLRAGTARIENEPAAAQIWINDHGRTVIYKLAYDEKYAPVSIGSLLSKRLFEHAIDRDRVSEIDYGVGGESYKRDWMSDRRRLGGVLACNRRTFAGFMTDLRERISAATRNLRHRKETAG